MHHVTDHTLRVRLWIAFLLIVIACAVSVLSIWSGAGSSLLISIGLAPNTFALAVVYIVGTIAGLYFLANYREYAWRFEPLFLIIICGMLFLRALDELLGAFFLP
jgi:hypothetical protein